MPARRILLLLSHQSYRAEAFLAAAGRMGLAVTVGTDREQSLAFLNPAGNLHLDFADPEAAIARARAFHEQHPLDAVVAAEDDGILLGAAIAEALGLPANPPPAVLAARDKHRARLAWRAAGLPGPRFVRLSLDEDPQVLSERMSAVEAHRAQALDAGPVSAPIHRLPYLPELPDLLEHHLPGFPCVLKPLALSASRGVIRADDPEGFVRAWRRLAAILARPEIAGGGGDWARHILVEDYLPGDEYALEGLLTVGRLQVLAIFDKPDPLEGPFFEETIYRTPSLLSPGAQAELAAAVEAAAGALGLAEGPVHAELRWARGEASQGRSSAGDPLRSRETVLRPAAEAPQDPQPRDSDMDPFDDERSSLAPPILLEIAPRSIGGLCGRSLRFVEAGGDRTRGQAFAEISGDESVVDAGSDQEWISLEALLLRHALGEDCSSWTREPAASGVLMIPIPHAGTFRGLTGLEAARATPHIEEILPSLAPGSFVEPPPEGAQYLGFAFSRAARPEQVDAALRQAHAQLEFQIDPIQEGEQT